MDTAIIGQGYDLGKDSSVAKELIGQFESGRYDSFTCLVAFASYSGISALTPYILREKKRGVKIKIILGVDQKGTSREALEEVLSWKVNAYVYHTNSIHIFHPKVYLFENTDIFTLIVGSNNLTEMGLVRNIECSLLVKDIRSNPVHGEFYAYWKGILDGTDVNLYRITRKLIRELHEDGLVASDTSVTGGTMMVWMRKVLRDAERVFSGKVQSRSFPMVLAPKDSSGFVSRQGRRREEGPGLSKPLFPCGKKFCLPKSEGGLGGNR